MNISTYQKKCKNGIKLTKNNMLDNYTYFHTNQWECFVSHLAHCDISWLAIPVIFWASCVDSNSATNSPSFVNCCTFLQYFNQKFLIAVSIWCFDSFRQFTLNQCKQFSDCVHHSKFSSLLSSRIPFLWFIKGLFSGLGRYAKAMSLCTKKFLWFNEAVIYQNGLFVSRKNLPLCPPLQLFAWLQTRPSSVIEYNPSYQSMSFIKVIKKIVYRMRYSTLGTLSSVCCNIREYYKNYLYNNNYIYG